MSLRSRIEHSWYHPGTPMFVARMLAGLYGFLAAGRRNMYRLGLMRIRRLTVPVVVVGNISVGGTGKTPLTLWLADRLLRAGRKPGIVCRAYAAEATRADQVSSCDDPDVKGDEAVLMARRALCPVWSGPDRASAAAAMLATHPELDVVLCDDGLQHYALSRDVEIAVVDATRGLGNGWLLPAGPLREPRTRLDEVDAIVFNGADTCPGVSPQVPTFSMRLRGALAVHVHDPTRTLPLAESRSGRLAAIAGIGNPERFFAHLRALGLNFDAHSFPDHYAFKAADLQRIQADCVLMTEKDAIKCARLPDDRLWMVPVEAEVDAALLDLIVARIGR